MSYMIDVYRGADQAIEIFCDSQDSLLSFLNRSLVRSSGIRILHRN